MRIATYNVEWFDALFDDEAQLLDDGNWSGRWDVRRSEQIAALGHVFRMIDADAVMVIEAPDGQTKGTRALENFARRFKLRARAVEMGFLNDTQQEIALMYDPDVMEARHVASEAGAPRFDQTFKIDLDIDNSAEKVRFSKPPLELEIVTKGGQMRMMGVHAKSKAPHGAKNDKDARRISIANRRKQLAQCIWLRHRVDAMLEAGDSLMVMGDFNDGPGLDEYEELFGRSGVEIVLGQGETALYDPHPELALSRKFEATPTTARFYLHHKKQFLQALLDYIMVSPDLRARAPQWCIWHPFDHPKCFKDRSVREALLMASDHFPLTLDIDWP